MSKSFVAPVWGVKKNEQGFTTGLAIPVKQRTLCTHASHSRSPLEKSGIFFCGSILYQEVKNENIQTNIHNPFHTKCLAREIRANFVATFKVQ